MEMEKIVAWAKRRGYIYPADEIYGGLNAIYNFGPYGALLKQNLRQYFIDYFVKREPNIFLLETALLTHPQTLQASGHLKNFVDKLAECKNCHARFRPDLTKEKCPDCGQNNFSAPQDFNLLFESHIGSVKSEKNKVYLRPETAQGMFTSYQYILDTMRVKLPFGLVQVGKSFRNEITARQFIFRLREFEIAEIEYLVEPAQAAEQFKEWLKKWQGFLESLGLSQVNLRQRPHQKSELAHYSQATTDIEYHFPSPKGSPRDGWGEIAGIANRGDYDLKAHSQEKGESLPYVIEPTTSLERLLLALICEGLQESDGSDGRAKGERVFKIKTALAPIKAGVFPLVKKPELIKLAQKIFQDLQNHFMVEYDEAGSIGRCYRRQDEIGTPFNITIDFDSLTDSAVTVRDRDTMKQKRVNISHLRNYLQEKLTD